MIALVPAAAFWLATFAHAVTDPEQQANNTPVGRAISQHSEIKEEDRARIAQAVGRYDALIQPLLQGRITDPKEQKALMQQVRDQFANDYRLISQISAQAHGGQRNVQDILNGSQNGGEGGGAARTGGEPTAIGPVKPVPMTPALRVQAGYDTAQIELDPNNPRPRYDRGRIDFVTGDDRGAAEDTGAAIKLGDHRPDTLILYSKSTALLGDTELAHQSAQLALQQDPENKQAVQLEVITRNRASTVHLDNALAAAGLAPVADGSAARSGPPPAPGDAGEAQSALAAGAAAAAQPGAIFAGGSTGGLTAAELAAQAAKQARVSPSNIQQSMAFTREAEGRLNMQDYNGALQVAKTATELNPANAQAWNYRAMAETHLAQYPQAVEDATYSLNVVPNMPARLTRSWAFSKESKYKEALADAMSVLEKDDRNAFAYKMAAFAEAGMGQRDAAVGSLQRAAELNPGFRPMYEAAVNAPANSDLMFLFDGAAPSGPSAPAAPVDTRRRFLRFVLLSLSGGLLMALGVLHVVSASWREKVNATVRRVLGGSREVGAGAATQPLELAGAGAPSGGFWAQYERLGTLGSGGMGVVYEGRDRSLDRKVAIKKMRDEIQADPAERQRFVTEARTVAGLHHPHIVDIFSIVEDGSDVYLVFEHVAGKTLAQRLHEGALPFEEARRVLKGVCEAVDYAHARGVIHRDLKPSNIMLSESGEPKVMDFGVARQAKDAVTKIMTNNVVGTPPYMAPEQEQGTVRKESDVFALGVCFYEMLSGELPFAGVGAGMLLNKLNGRLTPLSTRLNGKTPAGLDAVLAKALAPEPEKRYVKACDFLAAVEALSAAKVA